MFPSTDFSVLDFREGINTFIVIELKYKGFERRKPC